MSNETMTDARALREAIDRYWELAYAEGKDGRTHDTENGDAQKTSMKIDRLIARLRGEAAQCQTCNGHGLIGGPSYAQPDEGGVPCPDCSQAEQGQAVVWRYRDEVPKVKAGGMEWFWVAVRRDGGRIVSMPAAYLNGLGLDNDDDPIEKPEQGNRYRYDVPDEDEDHCMIASGWHDARSHGEYDTLYLPLLSDADELIAWMPMPDYVEGPQQVAVAGDAVRSLLDALDQPSKPGCDSDWWCRVLEAQKSVKAALCAAPAAPSSLPERDALRPNEEQGLFRKFDVRRTDGSDAPGGKHDGCEYFVLDLTHDAFAPVAAAAYAKAAEATHPQLAADICARYSLGAHVAALPAPPAPERTLYIDLDGVMADFDGAFPAVFGLDHRSLADEAMWAHINGHDSFFRDLPPMAGAIEFFRGIEHLRPVILTACPKSNYAHVAAQKRAWVREHLSSTCLVLPVLGGRHKPLFMHQPGDILIDDWGKNCLAWADAGGVAIKHEGDWAATRTALDDALRADGEAS